ncbi:hypothetical protein OF83DRAFT_457357 [Amylostereum chailletii]|nr:hypothetical protein OF83DRAFT_457357 [Amylostereum chailletii]
MYPPIFLGSTFDQRDIIHFEGVVAVLFLWSCVLGGVWTTDEVQEAVIRSLMALYEGLLPQYS